MIGEPIHIQTATHSPMAPTWRSIALKLEHKAKSKAVLEELVKSHRDQLEHFNEWFDEWGYDYPMYLEDAEAEQALYLRMVNEDNRYLRAWKSSLVWTHPVVHPF